MEFQFLLRDILLELPFDESNQKHPPKFNSLQCQILCRVFSSKLHKFLGLKRTPVVSVPSSFSFSRHWKSLSGFRGKSHSTVISFRKPKCKSNPYSKRDIKRLVILEELCVIRQGIKELYRVIKEAERFLQVCTSPEWWRMAVTSALTNELYEVHVHDLVWCIAGLDVALQHARGASVESWARLCRIRAAECYAEMAAFSDEDFVLPSVPSTPFASVVSDIFANREQQKHKYDNIYGIRKRVFQDVKFKVANFLLRKATRICSPVEKTLQGSSFHNDTLPGNLRIDIQEIRFPKRRRCKGRGAYGAVYEAFWRGTKVAVKEFAYSSHKGSFEDEASILVTLRNPFIVHLIGWCVDDENNLCYIVMELVEQSLESFIEGRSNRRAPFSLPLALDMMLQISRGMEYLHSNNIMHRDLKSSNVLVEPMVAVGQLKEEGYVRVKLCDFGLAKFKFGSSKLTPQVGTAYWRAPEVWTPDENGENTIEGLSYSFEAETYSFAMTCIEILTQKRPFADVASNRLLRQLVKDGKRPELPSTYPPVLIDYIKLCWSHDPCSRPSFANISRMLRHFKLLLMRVKDPEQLPMSLNRKEVHLSLPVLSFQDLKLATSGFTKRIRGVNLDCFFEGILSDGTAVLVQQLQGRIECLKDFWTHTALLFYLRHGNLACLRAVCLDGSQCWRVYDCPASLHGSLGEWLLRPVNEWMVRSLDTDCCWRIALGIACGVEFCHDHDLQCIVTPETVLLGDEFEPQIILLDLHTMKENERHEEVLDLEHRTDVIHLGIILSQLVSHMSIGQMVENSTQMKQLRRLNDIASLCKDGSNGKWPSMCEVVQMLMWDNNTGIESGEDCMMEVEDRYSKEPDDDYSAEAYEVCIEAEFLTRFNWELGFTVCSPLTVESGEDCMMEVEKERA